MSDETRTRREECWTATMGAVVAWRSGLSNGACAELRRCQSPSEVEMHLEFHRLRWQLQAAKLIGEKAVENHLQEYQLPLLVGLSAHLRGAGSSSEDSASFAKQLGRKINDRPVLSEIRFRRLMAETKRDDIYVPMIRVLRVLNGNVSLAALWKGLAWWSTSTRRTWAYAYYENN